MSKHPTMMVWLRRFCLPLLLALALFTLPAHSQQPDSATIRELLEEPPPQAVEEEPVINAEQERPPYFTARWFWTEADTIQPQRSVSAEKKKAWKADEDFWYANHEFVKKKATEQKNKGYVPLSERNWFQTLLWIVIIAGFAGFLVIYLSGNNVRLFRRRPAAISTAGEEGIPEDIFAIRYRQEIDKAVSSGNYRLAVRLMFLQLLKNMSDRGVIRYQHDKTNLDYLLQLRATRHYTDFFRITRHYEYSWYGQFEVSKAAFDVIRDEISRFDHQTGYA